MGGGFTWLTSSVFRIDWGTEAKRPLYRDFGDDFEWAVLLWVAGHRVLRLL
jgi:hypothetical protein